MNSQNPTTRPRMAATYAPGTVRARRWTACADLTDIHPISGQPLPRSVWWIIETKQ